MYVSDTERNDVDADFATIDLNYEPDAEVNWD
jgi:hypothetical protein